MFTYHKRYFIATIILLLVEISIALFVKDKFIRPYVGDFLIVIFLYCLMRSFLRIPVVIAASSVLLFAFTIELLQYLNLIEILGLQSSGVAQIVLGNHFDWKDIVAYTIGIIFVVSIEKWRETSYGKSGEKLN